MNVMRFEFFSWRAVVNLSGNFEFCGRYFIVVKQKCLRKIEVCVYLNKVKLWMLCEHHILIG